MKAKLKEIISHEFDDFESFTPDDCSNFFISMQLLIGPMDSIGEESFDIMLCSPNGFLNSYVEDEVVLGRHHIFMAVYNADKFIQFITNFLDSLEADSWDDLACQISKIGLWEYDDRLQYDLRHFKLFKNSDF